jgi:hypothetical protein
MKKSGFLALLFGPLLALGEHETILSKTAGVDLHQGQGDEDSHPLF